MDHMKGAQIPAGILPGVSVLAPGIALCLKHSQVDKRYVDGHIEKLSQQIPSELYPAFIAFDTSHGQFEHVLENLHRKRAEALRSGRVYFLYSPHFAPRVNTLMEHVDHLFYYSPGMSLPLVTNEKLNGERVRAPDREALFLTRKERASNDRKVLHITLPEGVNPDEATLIIGDAIAAKYSGSIDIKTVDSNEQ